MPVVSVIVLHPAKYYHNKRYFLTFLFVSSGNREYKNSIIYLITDVEKTVIGIFIKIKPMEILTETALNDKKKS